jgi:ATP-binding cassette subfamily C protein
LFQVHIKISFLRGKKLDKNALSGQFRPAIVTAILLSAFLNILVLSGSIYMMLVYDMIIPSRNSVSLIGLLIMLIVAYAFQTGLDVLRSDLLRKTAANLYMQYARPAYLASQNTENGENDPVKDLETVRSYLSGPGPGGLMDMPWMILYVFILFMLHFWIGVTTLIGMMVLAGLAWLTNHQIKEPSEKANTVSIARSKFLGETRSQNGAIKSLGMQERVSNLWLKSTETHLTIQQRLSSVTGNLSGISKTLRMLLQSLVITVGAVLVITDQATGGILFASSIIASRALAPMEATISSWKPMLAAKTAWKRISKLNREEIKKMSLPVPSKSLTVENLTYEMMERDTPILKNISFSASPGDVVAIIGPSAAGKTTLLKALAGQIPSANPFIRLDGASLDQWNMEDLGSHLGYLPQEANFLSGTIAQNISRFSEEADDEKIRQAAEAAGAHDMIVHMQDGYNGMMAPYGARQSGGQRQRIGLARALYGNPFLVLLDEPNSNLDAHGEMALAKAIAGIKKRGGITLVASHRPAIIEVSTHIMILRDGAVQAYGTRDEILPKLRGKNVA